MRDTLIQPSLWDAFEKRTCFQFKTWLERELDQPVELVITRNRISMLTIRKVEKKLSLRMNEHFLNAPTPVIKALSTYLRYGRRSAWAVIQRFAQDIPTHAPGKGREQPIRTSGRTYDIKQIYREVNDTFFNNRIDCAITWGRSSPKRKNRRRRCIQYGSYSEAQRLIRINPILDRSVVPERFIRYIVFHEMLHCDVPPVMINGRLHHHSAEFKRRENVYPDFEDMKLIARRLLHELT